MRLKNKRLEKMQKNMNVMVIKKPERDIKKL